jgi:hypothetical protein
LQQTIGAADILIDTAQHESPRASAGGEGTPGVVAKWLPSYDHRRVCVSVETNPTISSPFCGIAHSSSPSSRYLDEFNDVIVIAALWLG